MRRAALITLLGFILAFPANGGLGLGTANKPKPKPKQGGYRTQEQDAAYQKTIDDNDKAYKAQTDAVNSDAYPNYLNQLDSTYDAMVKDINNGGTGRIAGELPKFTPTPVAGTGSSTSSASPATAAATAKGGSAGTGESSPQSSYASPQQALIQNFCPKKCNTIGDEGKRYECMSVCARGAVATQSTPENEMSSFLLMSLLLNQE